MKIEKILTDEAILTEIGERIARRRLEFQMTQAALAREAGVAKRTLEHAEAGANVKMSTIIRIFRVLDLLPMMDQVLPESKPGPIEVMTRKGKIRQRAPSQHRNPVEDEPWTWGDDP
jgi:transcriptional regulator with XRE-family HTH domain